MNERYLTVDGVRVPRLLYGTAWKEDRTQPLVELALAAGFRGIDTANQRKHYDEAAVGQAIQAALARGEVTRGELFVQTKFTHRGGQDHRLPYDAGAPLTKQVEQSMASSLAHLGIQQIDSYVLHGPSQRAGLAAADWEVWRTIEHAYTSGQTRLLGVSNVSAEQLSLLADQSRVPPRFVQNRCYAARGWDRAVREVCAARGIVYQGFSLLTANPQILAHPELIGIARQHGRTPAQVVFRFAIHVGMIPLTGTTSRQHMAEDLAALEFALLPEEIARIETLGTNP